MNIENQSRSNDFILKAVIKNEQRIALLAKSNPKSFFHYVSTKTKAREPVSNLRNSEGGLTETDLQKAEVLQSFFQVFSPVREMTPHLTWLQNVSTP